MFRILFFLFFSVLIYGQQGYESKHNTKLKGWASSKEFNKPDVIPVDYNELKDTYLNKSITPLNYTKEFREYRYKNFYFDKNLKRSIKDRKASGWRQHSSNGSFGTLAYYRGNTSYQVLNGRVFIVKKIIPITKIKHVAKTDDSNYVFKLYNEELGNIYYEYNSKFEEDVEIELLKQ